jgi:hypothetical protein
LARWLGGLLVGRAWLNFRWNDRRSIENLRESCCPHSRCGALTLAQHVANACTETLEHSRAASRARMGWEKGKCVDGELMHEPEDVLKFPSSTSLSCFACRARPSEADRRCSRSSAKASVIVLYERRAPQYDKMHNPTLPGLMAARLL